MRRIVFVAFALSSPHIVAAKGLLMHVVAGPHQSARMNRGIGALDSVLLKSAIRITEPEGPIKKRGQFSIVFFNSGDKPVNVGPNSITANLADGTAVTVLSYEQLAHEEKRRQGWARFGAAMLAAGNSMNAANAGNTYGTATYSGSSFGSVGQYGYQSNTYGTATYSGYDATAAALANQTAQRQNEHVFQNLADRQAAGSATLQENLRLTTIDPGHSVVGSITFEVPEKLRAGKDPFDVVFHATVGDEAHEIRAHFEKQ